MQFSENLSLKPYNTFGIDVKARKFLSIYSLDELKKVLRKVYKSEIFILGGGSNMLLTRDIDKIVLHIALSGKTIISKTKNEVVVEAGAGENWHQFVLWTLEQGFGGLENLSLIPGNVGTAPIQNIGAYGVELKDSFVSCKTVHIQTLEEQTFYLKDCDFGYRNSVFKNELKGDYIITSVQFRLSSQNHHLNTDYGVIPQWLEKNKISEPGIKDISNAVIAIRQSKLPDPRLLGNSGSFFKNPIVDKKTFKSIQEEYPEIPFYALAENAIKIPAGWLIETAGFKGYREGDAGVHKNQALVLVNYDKATGEEVLNLATKIQQKIKETFTISLEPEVNII